MRMASVHYMSFTEIQWFPCKGVYHEHFLRYVITPKQRWLNVDNFERKKNLTLQQVTDFLSLGKESAELRAANIFVNRTHPIL